MSLEPGGRSDKYGNEYENRYLLRLLIGLVSGTLSSIVVEPLGENRDSVEYISVTPSGEKWFHQCKASNAAKTYWSAADLNRHHVFTRSKAILEASLKHRYEFVSPLPYKELSELCRRARTNSDPEELKQFQLTNPSIKAVFSSCQQYYGLNADIPEQLNQLADLLSRSYFETVHDGIEAVRSSEELVSHYFSGNPSSARIVLQNYINAKDLYGRSITAGDVIAYMEENGCFLRRHLLGDNLQAVIHDLNELYYNAFSPIKGKLIHREVSDEVLERIKLHQSVVLHGKAGMGKSGCIQEVVRELSHKGIPYLGIKLDKQIPSGSADLFGKTLGLGQSPVYDLFFAAGKRQCVLILDQLDSVRWTSCHSANALDVCKQMIRQAERLNQTEDARISLILISRTFDMETDAGLQSLLNSSGNCPLNWSKLRISEFTHKEAEEIIGCEYNTYPEQLQLLLRTPAAMYIWCRLEEKQHLSSIVSTRELMREWWKQLQKGCIKTGLAKERIASLKDRIVALMIKNSSFSIPEHLFSDDAVEIERLMSEGLIIRSGAIISFVHQSFFDYFASDEMMKKIYNNADATEYIGNYDDQTPFVRYLFSNVLQQLSDSDGSAFVALGREIIHSDNVRVYFKFAVLEIAGQQENPSAELCGFMYSLFTDKQWHTCIAARVYSGHPAYIRDLEKRRAFRDLNEETLAFLRSVYESDPEYVVGFLPASVPRNRHRAISLFKVLSPDLSYDTPKAQTIRLSYAEAHPELYNSFWGISKLLQSQSPLLIPILKSMIGHVDALDQHHLYLGEEKQLSAYSRRYYPEMIQSLLPAVCDVTAHFDPSNPNTRFNDSFRNWLPKKPHSFARLIVEMLKESMSAYYTDASDACLSFIRSPSVQKSIVLYDILASAILGMGFSDSDFAIRWLCDDPKNHLFIYTGCQDDYLSVTKKIIRRFSPYCSKQQFVRLEKLICQWKDPTEEMVRTFRDRINVQKQHEPVYYAYWGALQKELLPQMDASRLSKESRDLLCVLNRNEWIKTPCYYCGITSLGSGGVTSPIDKKIARISDRTWLSIISLSDDKLSRRFPLQKIDSNFVEATPRAFAASMASQARKEPERFAALALQFPENCNTDYVVGVLNAVRKPDQSAPPISWERIVSLIDRYSASTEKPVVTGILDIISRYADYDWPDSIPDYVSNMSLQTDFDDTLNRSLCRDTDNPESLRDLHIKALNCVPGHALFTLGKLLQHHPELSDRFAPLIEKLSESDSDSVRFALLSCIFVWRQIDAAYASALFRKLIIKDIRALGFPEAWDMILSDQQNNGAFYAEQLVNAVSSDIDDTDGNVAGMLCAYTVFFDHGLLSKLCKSTCTEHQVNEICRQAVSSFDKTDYHAVSSSILRYFIRNYDCEIIYLYELFKHNRLDIYRDEDLLTELMQSKHEPRIISAFVEYIKAQNQDITGYLTIIQKLSENVTVDKSNWNAKSVLSDLLSIVLKILERNMRNSGVRRICLDIWDNIYYNCYELVKPITELLDSDR